MKCHARLIRWLLVVIVLLAMTLSVSFASMHTKVAVLYPEVSNPAFNRVFDEIVEGIKFNGDIEVVVYAISGEDDASSLEERFRHDSIKAVIALGQGNYDLGQELANVLPVVHGGVVIEPETNGHSGVSLVNDPEQFFSWLVKLAPSVKRVYTVYSERSNGWMIRMADEAALQYGIELLPFEANSLREGMHKMRQVLSEVKDESDAVWMLFDRTLPDKTALPIVLEKAWDSRVVVFSNNPSHTRRGALFSLFPNHYDMGTRLGKLALSQRQPGATPQVIPTQDLKISVNERTASHLGFSISQSQRSEFDLIYPVQ